MRIDRLLALSTALFLSVGVIRISLLQGPAPHIAYAATAPNVAVGPQYDTTHVYVAPEDFDRFVASLLATFGGTTSKQGVFTVTPTPSSTMSQLVLTPAGTLSVFGFKTPVPYPFGLERTGYLVTDLDGATRAARANGADVLVSPFDDPIGRDAVIQWPGGVNMQLYWHTTPPSYAALQTIPENRVYVSPDRVAALTRSFLAFSHGKLVSDDARAPGVEIGRPNDTYRRVRVESTFGKLTVFVTDGHLPYPYGREMTGYEVENLADTLARAKAAGVGILAGPYAADQRNAAIVQFPGGYIAEIHSADGKSRASTASGSAAIARPSSRDAAATRAWPVS
jgi:predicted enzyme related to lactoylglutathione lyase